jgi:hypothetical protein
MISYSSWNGAKLHGQAYLITTVLKGELGFSGFVVSDWNGIDQIDGQPGFSAADVRNAVNAGIDMVMVPFEWRNFISTLRTEVQAGRVPMSRIDDANRRILTKKFELGLFERPLTDRTFTSTVGSAAHRTLARQAVRESQVLLKNRFGVLPLPKTGPKYLVAGRNADNIGHQSGGWTISWQGGSGNVTPGTTILGGIRAAVSPGTTVTYSADGTGIDGTYKAAIAVVGETPYAEGAGDRPGSMSLDRHRPGHLSRLRASGVPGVVVLGLRAAARHRRRDRQLGRAGRGLAARHRGRGVADVLFGDHNPNGKLPMTWMQSASQQPINAGDGKPPCSRWAPATASPPPRTPTTWSAPPTTTSSRHPARALHRQRLRPERGLDRQRRLAGLLRRRLRGHAAHPGGDPPGLGLQRHRHDRVPPRQHRRSPDRLGAGDEHRRVADLGQPHHGRDGGLHRDRRPPPLPGVPVDLHRRLRQPQLVPALPLTAGAAAAGAGRLQTERRQGAEEGEHGTDREGGRSRSTSPA